MMSFFRVLIGIMVFRSRVKLHHIVGREREPFLRPKMSAWFAEQILDAKSLSTSYLYIHLSVEIFKVRCFGIPFCDFLGSRGSAIATVYISARERGLYSAFVTTAVV